MPIDWISFESLIKTIFRLSIDWINFESLIKIKIKKKIIIIILRNNIKTVMNTINNENSNSNSKVMI